MKWLTNKRLFCSHSKIQIPLSLSSQYKNISNYYNDSDNAKLYKEIWGEGNFHPGYFPHLTDPSLPKLSFIESASELNKYMIDKSDINSASNVIDFGCGKGGPSIEVSEITKCEMLGIDLTQYHIDEANTMILKTNNKHLIQRCKFECKSFVDGLDDEKYLNKYSHCFSQCSIGHVQNYFDLVCSTTLNVLKPNGIVIWADFVGSKSDNDENYLSFLNRLHLPLLLSHDEFLNKMKQNGLKIELYEKLNNHVAEAYTMIADQAKSIGKHEWAKKWYNTANLAENDKFGMNVVVASKQKK